MPSFLGSLVNTLNVLLSLAGQYGLIVAAAFLLLCWRPFRELLHCDTSLSEKVVMILFFSALGILGTYTGTPVMGAVANLRTIGVVTGGLLGGPLVGTAVGLIAGGHRILMDIHGSTAASSALATFLEGLAAGLVSLRLKAAVLDWRVAFAAAFAGEGLHMLLVLATARPAAQGWMLVRVIALPTILVNAVGAALFVRMLHFVQRDRQRHAAIEARKALEIANQTVSHLRAGLTRASADATARIIFASTAVAAVAVSDTARTLALVAADGYRTAVRQAAACLTRDVLADGRPRFMEKGHPADGRPLDGPLKSAIAVPLAKGGRPVGTLSFYGGPQTALDEIDFQIALGLAHLFSTQLELEDIRIQSELRANAEIRRPQAQINPHFLFNALNTIGSFCRTDPQQARRLIRELSTYLRRNLDRGDAFVSLAEELEQVRSYLSIEQARFGDRIAAFIDIQAECADWPIPPLVIQPLVENAVKHGLGGRENGGWVRVEARRRSDALQIRVSDNGIGMPPDAGRRRSQQGPAGIGLANIRQRLAHIYGPDCRLRIDSRPDAGVTVRLRIPRRPVRRGGRCAPAGTREDRIEEIRPQAGLAAGTAPAAPAARLACGFGPAARRPPALTACTDS